MKVYCDLQKLKRYNLSAISCVLFFSIGLIGNAEGAAYTTTSKTAVIPAGTYGGDVNVGITDTYGITDGIRTTVSSVVSRTTATSATGVYFNGGTGIGDILATQINAKSLVASSIVYGLRFQNAKQTNGKKILTSATATSAFQARGALYVYGTSAIGDISGTYTASTTSSLDSAYAAAIILNSTSTIESFEATTVSATGANAYGISSNRTIADSFDFKNGNSISASGSLGSFIFLKQDDSYWR